MFVQHAANKFSDRPNSPANPPTGNHTNTMERINISFTPRQLERMRKHSEETGINISELLRRLVDEFFKQADKEAIQNADRKDAK